MVTVGYISTCSSLNFFISNSEFIAISTPPWLCPLLFGGLSLLYTLYRLAGKYSVIVSATDKVSAADKARELT